MSGPLGQSGLLLSKRDERTYVQIRALGFAGRDEETVTQALDSTEGFSFVIAARKRGLGQGIEINAVNDKALKPVPKA